MKFEKIKSIKRIGIEETSDLVVKKNHNFIANGILVHNSGYGKGLALEGIAEKFHKLGYIVLVISDIKNELEFCYQMFEPIERYHLDHLKKIGKPLSKKKVKIYHPFTFDIPTKQLPDINFYTFSLKELRRKEWGLIAETAWDTETMRLLLQASQSITKEDGIYGLIHYVQDSIKGKKSGKGRKPDPKSFYLESGSGTMKSVAEISNYLQPFKNDYFLAKDTCSLNLNWKNILTDQENYHVFVSNWIRDEKLKDFCVLALLNGILEHKDILKKPILVIIPEIRKQCPFRPEGHKKFLAESIRDSLTLMRSSGRGMSSLLDSQVYIDIDEGVRNSATVTLFGELGGGADMERVAKAFNYKTEFKDQLKKMDYPNSFIWVGKEDRQSVTIFFPSSMHCEPSYNFIDMYRERLPEKMKDYKETIDMMKKMYDGEVSRFKDKIKRQEQQEKEEKERKLDEKEERKSESESDKDKDEKIRELKDLNKLEKMKKCWEFKQENPDLSLRESAKRLGFPLSSGNKTFKKYIDEYQVIAEKEKEKEQKIDYEDKVLSETKTPEEIPLLGEDFDLPEE